MPQPQLAQQSLSLASTTFLSPLFLGEIATYQFCPVLSLLPVHLYDFSLLCLLINEGDVRPSSQLQPPSSWKSHITLKPIIIIIIVYLI